MGLQKQCKGDILVIDDLLTNVRLLSEILTIDGYEVREVLSGKDALKIIDYDPPELILLDIMMPEMDGYEVCRQIKLKEKYAGIPIIFVSAKGELFDKVKGFQVGGVDYITKPFFIAEVLCRVNAHLSNYRYNCILAEEIKARKKAQESLEIANEKLAKLVNIDGLTQISNRRYFDETLEKEWKLTLRHQHPISLIIIDIDYFKLYNDTYGHILGDETLKSVAKVFDEVIQRSTDLASRYGGEEFAIILPHTEIEGAEKVAQRIIREIRKLAIPHEPSPISDYVTLSMGISCVIPTENLSPEILVSQADKALYLAKSQGRNRAVTYT